MSTAPIELIPGPPVTRPDWLKVRLPSGDNYNEIKSLMRGMNLHTVCEELAAPTLANAGVIARQPS